ncbi:hypothetical protein HPP92_022000 [Vanilla planifolia]|uniref:Uncharacterized protein n=1 Tax=Vanilla planifolia TaxID=51239 RepID=A0A835UEQ1_VANPL|nr:hypothetical protein HPP92_022000 [Vanilla planifolia]
MRGTPFSFQGKGTLEAVTAQVFGVGKEEGGVSLSCKRKKGEVLEPRSVLDHRSPSPPTSSSTLSSSLGCAGGPSDTVGVAVVTETPSHQCPPTNAGPSSFPAEAIVRKEEWSMELQPIGGVLEMSAEKCGSGVNDWEMMFSESAATTNQEQTFLRWIMDDIDDPSTGKQHHHQLQQELFASAQAPLLEYDAGVGGLGFGLVDPGLEFEVIGEHGRAASVSATSASCIGSSQRNSKPALSPPLSIVLGGKM